MAVRVPEHLDSARHAVQRHSDDTDDATVRERLRWIDERLAVLTQSSETPDDRVQTSGERPHGGELETLEERLVDVSAATDGAARDHVQDARMPWTPTDASRSTTGDGHSPLDGGGVTRLARDASRSSWPLDLQAVICGRLLLWRRPEGDVGMAPHDQPGRPAGQPTQSSQQIGQTQGATPGGQQDAVQQAPPASEMTVSTPTLRWISLGHPQEQVPIGKNDYVIESVFNPQMDGWEVLVLLQPGEGDEDDEEE